MKPTDPKVSRAVTKLQDAERLCDQWVDELAYFEHNQPPYLGNIVNHFRSRSHEAENLKMAILAVFTGLGELGEQWF
ncbi:MAG: hypothetical protein DMG59_27405, partial [Acidobacteria bacterium]